MLLEQGDHWMNVKVVSANINPELYMLTALRGIVDGGRMATYAMYPNETAILQANNFTTLSPAISTADEGGYNTGNILLGRSALMGGVRIYLPF